MITNLNRKLITLFCLALMFLSLGTQAAAQNSRVFTPQELANFNGQNGARAYVVVNDIVYDLTDVPQWARGRHYCSGAIAGKDITFLWNLVPPSHRDTAFLKRFPVVGRLVRTNKPQPQPSPVGTVSLAKTLILGLLIAVFITAAWIFIRFKKR